MSKQAVVVNPGSVVAPEKADPKEAAALVAADEKPASAIVAVGTYSLGGKAEPFMPASLRIAHGMSKKEPDGIAKGSLCLTMGDETKWSCNLAKPGQSVRVCILGMNCVWRERQPQPYQAGYVRKTYATEAEAVKDGKVTSWQKYDLSHNEADKPNCNEEINLKVLIEKPEGLVNPFFCIVLDGKEYAPAWVTVGQWSLKTIKLRLQMALVADQGRRHVTKDKATLMNAFFTTKTISKDTKQGSKVWFLDLTVDPTATPNEQFGKDLSGLMMADAPVDGGEDEK